MRFKFAQKTAVGLGALGGLMLSFSAHALQPPRDSANNQKAVVEYLHNYYTSGTYQKELIQIANQAQIYLAEQLVLQQKLPNPKKLAMVLDIDETALSNYNFLAKSQFKYTPENFNRHLQQSDDIAILPILLLYDYAQANDVSIFFISDRPESLRKATEKNLIDAGYKRWHQVILKPSDYQNPSISPFKQSARAAIEQDGYRIILNIGDQASDLSGEHAAKSFKLPNPFYFVP